MLELDKDVKNADWAKIDLDISVKNINELRELLSTLGISVAEFKKLPVYQFNKDKIPWLKEL